MEIGASVAGGVSELANMTSSAKTAQRLGLIAAGSAAGISAGFGAPIAGLFFAFESILQPAASRGSLPTRGGSTGFGPLTTESVILASVLAAVVSNQILGDTPVSFYLYFPILCVFVWAIRLTACFVYRRACWWLRVSGHRSGRSIGSGDSRGPIYPVTPSTPPPLYNVIRNIRKRVIRSAMNQLPRLGSFYTDPRWRRSPGCSTACSAWARRCGRRHRRSRRDVASS